MDYTGKHVLVLGLGESGLASALWLAHCGATVRVADTRSAPERLPLLQQAIPAVEFFGSGDGFDVSLLDGIDFAVTSPGLAPAGELKEILSAATDRNIPVWGEIEVFAQALAALRESRAYAPKVIAITGTNGKTTVTSLTGLLCERAGLTVQVAGNISPAALDVLRSALEKDALPQVWVLELSSFQLHSTCNLRADAATILNITQDHLDWHGDMASYVADKARIFSADTVRVLNRDDPLTMQFNNGNCISFGFDEPLDGDCFGLVSDNGMQWLSVAVPGDEEERAADGNRKRRNKKEQLALLPVSVKRLMPADALRIRGRHNAANALAALALCRAIDLPFAPLLHGLREYHGEPHRVELVTTIGGVEYYDDSKGTNVGATVAALNGLGRGCDGDGTGNANPSRLLLIAGGEGKGQDFAPLAAPLAAYGRALLLIGRDSPAIRAAVEKQAAGIAMIDCATLEEAVTRAAELAHAGDAVLLSPACASFDMFRNYAHRAQVFVDAVRELALSRGEVGL
jgi:UDP-N-acetylmuramoylalanine--D-glutamate ligase